MCLYGVEKILFRLEHRIQCKCGYLWLAPNALVEKIMLQLEYIEFKVNVVILALLRMPYSECPTPYSSMFCSGKEMRLF